MVQQASRVRLPHARGGDAGYLRPYGNFAPVRADRTAAGAIRPGALRAGPEGHDGGRSAPRKRTAGSRLALTAFFRSFSESLVRAACMAAMMLVAVWAASVPARAAGTDTIEIVSASGVHP